MQLAAEEFHSLILAAGPLGYRRPGEKRLHLRVGVDSQVTIIPLGSAHPAPMQVHVIDVSRRGILLRRPEPMEAGQQFIVCLSLDGGRKTQTVVCVVRRVAAKPKHGFEIGCEFAGDIQPAIPSDQVLKGLKKFQMALFAADMEMV